MSRKNNEFACDSVNSSFPVSELMVCEQSMDHAAIFRDLQASLDEALRRAEDRLSHVHRQLAGGQPEKNKVDLSEDDNGWQALQTKTDSLTAVIDNDLASVQTALTELVQQGRQIKKSLLSAATE